MGKRLVNWLSKASAEQTKRDWLLRWMKFAKWVTSEKNPLTNTPYLSCAVEEVDDRIRVDFENMPSHLFHDKWRDILTKYVAYLEKRKIKSNTAVSYITSVRSFFSNEATSIKLQKGKIPPKELAMGEHRFTLQELRQMWLVADREGKARLSTAVSLGWSVGDFATLRTQFIRDVLKHVDDDGYCVFDFRRGKTKARIRGLLNPGAVKDLQKYLSHVPENQRYLWSAQSKEGLNYWIKSLCKQAGINENGQIRFHLIRKYVFDVVASTCGQYEAKLLTGKIIPLSDATYLHGLEDRLLERYKKFAYPLLRLNGTIQSQQSTMERLSEEVESLKFEVEEWKTTAIRLKKDIREIQETRRESDLVMDRLFEDAEFRTLLRQKLKELT
jgi:hypothetical protein